MKLDDDQLSAIYPPVAETVRWALEQIAAQTFDANDSSLARFAAPNCHGWSPRLRDTLAAPVEQVLFFAGEATSRDSSGYVHGALESGFRAADEVIDASGTLVNVHFSELEG